MLGFKLKGAPGVLMGARVSVGPVLTTELCKIRISFSLEMEFNGVDVI